MNAAIYARTATPDPEAIRHQTEVMTRQIRDMWGINTEIDIYTDNGISSLQTTRPGLQKLLQKAGTYNGVFVWDMARLSRSVPDTINLYRQLKAVGAELYAADGNVKEIMEGIMEAHVGFST